MSFQWETTPDKAWGALAATYRAAIENAIKAIADRYAPEIEEYMKINAPWVDRTSNARQGLHTEVEQAVGEFVTLWLKHRMTYGWYLEGINPATMEEMRNAGRWAIINPALDVYAPRIWATIQETLRT
jgi:hypothetical protein